MSSDELAIRELQQKWFDATARGDLAEILLLMSEDIVFLVAGQKPFGRVEFAERFEAAKGKAKIQGSGSFEEVIVSGDVAYARGKLSIAVTPENGPTKRMAGYTLSVFRRVSGGRWVLARDANFVG